MTPYYDKDGLTIYNGHCLEVLKTLPDNSLDSVVTDPPYGLSKQPDIAEVLRHWLNGDDYEHTGGGFMGKDWDSFVPGPSVWKECLRVLKPGGHLLAFAGTRTVDLMGISLRLGGFEIRDTITNLYDTNQRFQALWETLDTEQRKLFHQVLDTDGLRGWGFGTGFPKSLSIGKKLDQMAGKEREVWEIPRNGGPGGKSDKIGQISADRKSGIGLASAPATPEAQQWEGFGTGLKPALEPILLCRKPISEKTIAANVLRWGVGGLAIDRCRVGTEEREQLEAGFIRNGRTDEEVFSTGYGRPKEKIGVVNGRFPANLIIDDSEQVRALFPETSQAGNKKESVFKRKQKNAYGKYSVTFQNPKIANDNGGSAARFFYCCSQDALCALCDLPCVPKHSIMNETASEKDVILCNANTVQRNLPQRKKDVAFAQDPVRQSGQQEKEGKLGKSNASADNAEKNLKTTQETNQSTAQKIALMKLEKQLAQNVKSAGSLCDLCTIRIAHVLAKIKTSDFNLEELQAILDCMPDYKSSILIQNLVHFAELWENTDTIPTIQSLSILFGSVHHAIRNYIPKTKRLEPNRLIYQAKASKSERNAGLPEGATNIHNTVKPLTLMKYLVRLITPPGGTVLDPFLGSGTTLLAARAEGFQAIGIELEEEYCQIAVGRLGEQQPIFDIPTNGKVKEQVQQLRFDLE